MASQKSGKRKTGRPQGSSGRASSAKKTSQRSRSGASGSRAKSASGVKRTSYKGNQRDAAFFELQNEIILMVTLVVAVLLLLSNFNLGGTVGGAVNGFMFGLFGLLNYLFPVLLFCGTAFFLANRGNRALVSKMLYLCGMVLMIMALIQLVTPYSADQWSAGTEKAAMSLKDYFTLAKQYKKGGGFFGGFVCFLFEPLFGKVGSFVVMLALFLVCFMLFSRKAIFAWIAKITSERYAEHKVHADERREYYEQRQAERARIIEEKRREMGERRAKTFLLSEEERKTMQNDTTVAAPVQEPAKEPNEKKNFFGGKTPTGNYVYGNEYTLPKETVKQVNSLYGEERKQADKNHKQETGYGTSASPKERELSMVEISPETGEYIGTAIVEPKKTVSEERKKPTFTITSNNTVTSETRESKPVQNTMQNSTVSQTSNGQLPAAAKRRGPTMAEELMALGMEKDRQTSGGKTYFEVSPNEAKKKENEPVVNYDAIEQDDIDATGVEALKNLERRDSAAKTSKSPEAQTEKEVSVKEPASGKQSASQTASAAGSTADEPLVVEETEPIKQYEFPSTELLTKPKASKVISEEELSETAMKLQTTLDSFGVRVTVNNVSCGPAVTRYELLPEQGVKVSKITSLADDIKLNLAAADVRIEAPIPGKAAVGIEVPNKENSTVFLRELLESKEFNAHSSKVAFAVGKDIGGQTVVTDIAKMPHLLIAGATGSGKSVCINTLIMSILYKADPKDVKLIMVDPKVVELSVYNGIPHLMIPVVTDPKKASAALNWAVMEMTDRYNKFAELGVRDLKGYNERVDQAAAQGLEEEKYKRLPQIVIIVDELADLMMVAPGEVEDSICRLAQLARAAGLHLVIATQRPSVNVITGVIKANIPSRIAFAVSSAIDSRTILDGAGAEKLLGKGDMLFFPSGYSKPVRVQGAFVSDNEVSAVVDFLKSQCDGSTVNTDIMNKITAMPSASENGSDGGSSGGNDEYFADAGKLIIEKDKASIGMLQRAYKIGFNRAARIMDQLADAGVVGPEEGTKPRKVLMTAEEFENYLEG